MTVFILGCLAMLAVAALFIGFPFLKARATLGRAAIVTPVLAVLLLGGVAAAVYFTTTKWSWRGDNPAAQVQTAGSDVDVEAMVGKLEAHLKDNPQDLNGWLLLGRSYVTLQRYALSINAYQQAHELDAANLDATLGLAEALVLNDEAAFAGRGGQLIDEALKQNPRHPKALWYGGLAALRTDNLPLARDRFQTLLTLDPPEQIRGVLERQIQDLNEQIAGPGAKVAPVDPRKLVVQVSVDPAIQKQIKEPLTLFVLARNPKQPGAPLAVERHQASELPLTVELTTDDAMLPTRSIADADAVQVVARLSRSGTPTEQPGDFFGTADYDFAKGTTARLKIVITQQVK